MGHWSARDITNTDSYVALQKLPARRVTTSMPEPSQKDIVVNVEKDWFIYFEETKHSVSELPMKLSIGFPGRFTGLRTTSNHASLGL
jgi:hypothetical protein